MPSMELLAARLGIPLFEKVPSLSRVDSPELVVTRLHEIVSSGADIHGNFVSPFQREKFKGLDVDPFTFTLVVVQGTVPTAARLRLYFTLGALTYSFDAEVLDRGDGNFTVRTPQALDFGEQRHARRWPVSAGRGAVARLPGYAPGRASSLSPLLDISVSGLSLLIGNVTSLGIGMRPRRMEILVGGEKILIPRVEVRHVTPLETPGQARVGFEIGVERRPIRPIAIEFPLPSKAPARGPRSAARALEIRPHVDVVRYFDRCGERIVGILDTTFGERAASPVPVVILPPSTGRRKETLSALGRTLIENFARRGRDIAVLRFDGIRRHGESTNDPEGRVPGCEMIHATMGQAIEDIHATLDFLYANERLTPSKVIIVSSSSASIEARRAIVEDGGRRMHYWVSLAGSPDFHDTLRNICGGLDLLGSWRNGVRLGVQPVLGNPVDLDHFFPDAFERRLVYLREAMDEIDRAKIPITWIYGLYDDWVRPERVMNLMSVRSDAPREVLSIPTGHQMRTSEEAIEAFKLISACIWKFLHGSRIRPCGPDPRVLADMREAEKARLARPKEADHRGFWRDYLERKDRYLGFDIICETDAYRDLMSAQIEMLDLREGIDLLDAGGGTGNFVESLLDRALGPGATLPKPRHVTLADYVPEALETARSKILALQGRGALPDLAFRVVDLELSRLQPVAEALAPEGFRWDALYEAVEGMPPTLLRRLIAEPDPIAETVARGEDPEGRHAQQLAAVYGAEGAEILGDLGRAARFVRRALVAGDLVAPSAWDLDDSDIYERLDASALRWRRLAFGRATLAFRLPFPDAAFDRIVSSLVVCYLFRPHATIREFYRMLRPEGVLVLSSMKPDADVSRIYMRLIERLCTAEDVAIPEGLTREDLLTSARTFLNKASGILNLEEAGAFEFVDRERLVQMFSAAGFTGVQVVDSFGDPPQAYIVSGRRA